MSSNEPDNDIAAGNHSIKLRSAGLRISTHLAEISEPARANEKNAVPNPSVDKSQAPSLDSTVQTTIRTIQPVV